jgi:predicted DnaQ family exonuclease/DinG family helicase
MAETFVPGPLPPDLLSALGLERFVAFDVETTGLDPKYEQMIEMGAIRFEGSRETDRFSSLISCSRSLPQEIVRMTGINDDMLTDAPSEKTVVRDFLNFVGDEPLIGHHVSFDLSFLTAAAERAGRGEALKKRLSADSALLARVLLPTLPSRSLSSLRKYFNLDCAESHRALPDARACGQVLLCLLPYLPRVDIKTVDLLRRIAAGLNHPSAWIFPAWADYLIRTSSLEGRMHPYHIPFLSDNIIGKLNQPSYSREGNEDSDVSYQNVDVAEVAAFFSQTGSLARSFPHYEQRPQQEEMARGAADVLNEGGVLAVEAGTGVGKSLAYLVPAIRWAQANAARAQRVIVSTNTKNLQEQLFYKDLPQLSQSLPVPFSAVLLKGRNNYLCLRRWENLVTEQPLKLSQGERLALLPLVLWASQTRTGDVAEVGSFGGEGSLALWNRIASDQNSCRGRRCQEFGQSNRCFHAGIRAAAARAHVVVVNHALLMADIAAEHAPIGAYSTLIVDEAHHLGKAAAQHLGRELNSRLFAFWARRLSDGENPPQGMMHRILLGLGAAKTDHPALPGIGKLLEEAAHLVGEFRQAAADYFRDATAAVRQKIAGQTGGSSSANGEYTPKLRLRDPAEFFGIAQPEETALYQSLKTLVQSLGKIVNDLGDIPLTSLPRGEEWKDEISSSLDELLQMGEVFKFYLAPPSEDWVYWAELPRKQEYDVMLFAAPLNVSAILGEQLFQPLRCAILTSATLTVAGRFHYFLKKMGLSDAAEARTLQVGSPFDFERQMTIALPAFLPSPRQPSFETQIAMMMQEVLQRLPRGALGLFTSYRTLRSVGELLRREMPERTLLIQGQDGSRDHLLRQFREEPRSILLGTDSFWEGIDVVGDALELLIVAKLPFEVPSEPLVEARLEKLKKEGKDAFMYYTVPEAIIRLRQGVGRLIRSKTDRGAAILCDTRLVQSRYGEAFLQSLPAPVQVFDNAQEMVVALERFFGG